MARVLVLCIALLLVEPAFAAQQKTPPVPPEQETDLPDIIRAWRHKPPLPATQPGQKMTIIAPVIGSNPSAGFLIGVAAQMAFFRGEPSTTRISSGMASLTISTKSHMVANVRFDTFSEGNRWLIEGDNRFQSLSQDIYGFGTETPPSAALNTR